MTVTARQIIITLFILISMIALFFLWVWPIGPTEGWEGETSFMHVLRLSSIIIYLPVIGVFVAIAISTLWEDNPTITIGRKTKE